MPENLTLEDREEIRVLSVKYMYFLDRFNPVGLKELFTEDVVWDGDAQGHGRHEGVDALMNFFRHGVPGQPHPKKVAHIVTNHLIEASTSNTAEGICYYYGQSLYADRGYELEIGFYQDGYRKGDGGWKFSQRVLNPLLPTRIESSH